MPVCSPVFPGPDHTYDTKTGFNSSIDQPAGTGDVFQKQLSIVVDEYLVLKNALVASDEKKAGTAARETLKALEKADMSHLKGNSHIQWMHWMKQIKTNLNGIVQVKGIEMKRTHFITVSEKLVEAVKAFGTDTSRDLYQEFCPMVNNNKGAVWISPFQEIKNPYFRKKMLTCGEIKDTLN